MAKGQTYDPLVVLRGLRPEYVIEIADLDGVSKKGVSVALNCLPFEEKSLLVRHGFISVRRHRKTHKLIVVVHDSMYVLIQAAARARAA